LTARRTVQISPEAHSAAKELAGIYGRELGLTRVSLQDAVSLAIIEAIRIRKAVVTAASGDVEVARA
jgi:hypothetical protein